MIIIVEPECVIRKKLSDMLSQEIIMAVSEITDVLEKICLHKNEIDLIVADIQTLQNEVSHHTIAHLCDKIYARKPPMLGIYRAEEVGEELKKVGSIYRLIEYDEKDPGFPMKYLEAITDIYPQVKIDIGQAAMAWQEEKTESEMHALHKWLEKEGLLTAEEKGSSGDQPVEQGDYKRMYFELQDKYNRLLAYLKELIDSVKTNK